MSINDGDGGDVLLTVKDVATILQCSEDSVIRRFAKVTGVIDLGKPEAGWGRGYRRRYRVLRIPKSVVERFLTAKSGRSVRVAVPTRAERRRKSDNWETQAIMNLAKAGMHNDASPTTLQRIANRARLLMNVPENRWADIVWFEDED